MRPSVAIGQPFRTSAAGCVGSGRVAIHRNLNVVSRHSVSSPSPLLETWPTLASTEPHIEWSTRPPGAVGASSCVMNNPHHMYICLRWHFICTGKCRNGLNRFPPSQLSADGGTLAEPCLCLVIHNITVECYPPHVADDAYRTQGFVLHTTGARLHIGTDPDGCKWLPNASPRSLEHRRIRCFGEPSAKLIAEIGRIPLPFSIFFGTLST